MRPEFKQALGEYSAVAKQELAQPSDDADTARLVSEINTLITKYVSSRASEPEAQVGIYSLQKRKQAIMERLRHELRTIKAGETSREHRPGAYWVEWKDGDPVWMREDGSKQPISLGQLFTDGAWGIDYQLDPDSVPKKLQQHLAVQTAKRELTQLLHRQIALDEDASRYTQVGYGGAHRGIIKGSEQLIAEGIILEYLVQSFLKKISLDHPVDFTVEPADPSQDVQQKCDFIVKVSERRRGINVSVSKPTKAIGIQLTTSASKEVAKTRQVESVKTKLEPHAGLDDIVVVVLPYTTNVEMLRAWQSVKTPGGPDALWDLPTKRLVFKGVLKKMFPAKKLQAMWREISATQSHLLTSPSADINAPTWQRTKIIERYITAFQEQHELVKALQEERKREKNKLQEALGSGEARRAHEAQKKFDAYMKGFKLRSRELHERYEALKKRRSKAFQRLAEEGNGGLL